MEAREAKPSVDGSRNRSIAEARIKKNYEITQSRDYYPRKMEAFVRLT